MGQAVKLDATQFINANTSPMPNNYPSKLIIVKARQRSGLTVRAMAEILGIGKSTLHRYEKGLQPPSRQAMQKLQSYFRVASLDELIALLFHTH